MARPTFRHFEELASTDVAISVAKDEQKEEIAALCPMGRSTRNDKR
jgi:hypothetical protein